MALRSLTAESLFRAGERVDVNLRVFLAGPFIKPSEACPIDGDNLKARQIRHFIFKQLASEEQINAVIGEHEQLVEAYRSHFRAKANAALAEMAHVTDHSDCVIIIPSSPGSFAELGYFAASETVCKKMLIVVDSQYEKHVSYINLGPISMAVGFGAKCIHVDYSDQVAAWASILEHLTDMRVAKLASRYTLR